MNSIQFLEENLKKLHNSFSNLDIRYEYRGYINTHIIDVRPKSYFETDEPYALEQISLETHFEELFPNEEILFITENKLVNIENPILELLADKLLDFKVIFDEPFFGEMFFNDLIIKPTHFKCSPNDWTDFVEIEKIKNSNQYELPPPKSWWSSLKNKKSSKKDLELFFV